MITNPKCFVITPYGKKLDANGNQVDFDVVFNAVVEKAIRQAGLVPQRSDLDPKSGLIFVQMISDIAKADVCIADITTLNPNVFYELGVRHALRRGVTILIRMKDHPLPFDISMLRVFTYGPPGTPEFDGAVGQIVEAIKMTREKEPDSLVFRSLPDLKVEISKPTFIEKIVKYRFPLKRNPRLNVGLIGGNLADVRGVSVWVNSENTDMQMSRYHEPTISGTIRYSGAKKGQDGHVQKDLVADDLAAWKKRNKYTRVQPGTVVRTTSGELSRIGVKFVLHVASVEGIPRHGYRSVSGIRACVINTLEKLDEHKKDFRGETASIVFPLLGTGAGGSKVEHAAPTLFKAALDYLEDTPGTVAEKVWFLTHTEENLTACRQALAELGHRLRDEEQEENGRQVLFPNAGSRSPARAAGGSSRSAGRASPRRPSSRR